MRRLNGILTILLIIICIALGASVNSCSKRADVSAGTTPIPFVVPAGFPEPQYTFENNARTQQGFELGRKLFYDGMLSKDGNFPCASCHQQAVAFATYDHDLSHGYNDQFTTRNTPGLFNLVWMKEMHWDGGSDGIETAPVTHITAPNEMAEDINHVISKLQQDDNYKKMFSAAFGSDEINSQKMLKALAQFTGSMVSASSRYDQVKRGEKSFTTAEQTGYGLFQEKCTTCHKEPLFTDQSYRNTGLPLNASLKDYGRMRITGRKEDSLKFKVPSLRNVMVSGPYMHDGRFFSVDNALNHYAAGVQPGATLDPLLKNKIVLTTEDKYYIKTFLFTLTDSAFLNDKRFMQP